MLTNIPVLHTACYNYNTWQRGKEIASSPAQRCDYWTGYNSVRETPRFYYLLIMGTAQYNGSSVFSHHVHRVDKKALAGQDIQKLANKLNCFELDHNYEFLTQDND